MEGRDASAPGGEIDKPYWCFISYRHADNKEKGRMWAGWLHRELETYPVPDELVGQTNQRGETIPPRIFPVFRDEEELPAYADLSTAIIAAINRSLNLVVICSPRACESRFVNDEIRLFKARGMSSRIYGMVVSGDPDSSGADGCLPAALRHEVDGAGTILDAPAARRLFDFRSEGGDEGWTEIGMCRQRLRQLGLSDEEAEAEARERAGRAEASKLELIAAVLGVDPPRLAEAHRRHQAALATRRRRNVTLLGLGSIAALAAIVASIQASIRNQAAAAAADTLIHEQAAISHALQQQNHENQRKLRERTIAGLYAEGMRLAPVTPVLAASQFRQAAEKLGHPPSMLELGKILVGSSSSASQRAEGLYWIRKASELGHPAGMRTLALHLAAGDICEADRPKAEALLRQAMAAGDKTSGVELARMTLETDAGAGLEQLTQLAREGSSEAAWALANLFRKGAHGITPDSAKAVGYLRRCADSGHPDAQRELGIALCSGLGVPRDMTEGLKWLKLAATAGDQKAAAARKSIYADIANAPQNPAEAVSWHMAAAEVGIPNRQVIVGQLLAESRDEATLVLAETWLRQAEKAREPGATCALGMLMMRRARDREDREHEGLNMLRYGAQQGQEDCQVALAREWTRLSDAGRMSAIGIREREVEGHLRAAEQRGNPEARRLLASWMIKTGQGEEALGLLRKALAAGDGKAALMMGDWMAQNARSREHWTQALDAYLSGAKFGNADCLYKASLLVDEGKGASKDASRATGLMRQAAEAGQTDAMARLARRLADGAPPSGRLAEAHAWATLAWRSNHRADDLAGWINSLESRMSKQDLLDSVQLQGDYRKKSRSAATADPKTMR